MSKTIIIAEAGVNHNASLDMALALVDAAAEAGADIVKFQTAVPELVVTAAAAKAEYQQKATGSGESQLEMIRRLHLPLSDFEIIAAHCERRGILFLSTAFDLVSLKFLARLDPALFKVPSGEITNLPYLRQIGSYRKPVILSTGMSTIPEIEGALNVLVEAGTPRDRITVLQCNTEYPTPMSDVNLTAMLTMRDELGVAVGYSDHTLGIEVAIAAAALGASVIEKHFTLDRTLPGPDHRASLDPNELIALVAAVRNIEQALGDGIKRPTQSELKNMPIARRSIVAASAIRAGEIFSEANLAVKRPGTGVSPMRWDDVIGRKASHDFAPDDFIDL